MGDLSEESMVAIMCGVLKETLIFQYDTDEEYIAALAKAFNQTCDIVLKRLKRKD